MSEPRIVEALETLLEAVPGADAAHLRIDDRFESGELEDSEVDAVFDDFVADHRQAVEDLTRAWGDPEFDGAVDADDFPEWSEALVLAVWRRGEALAYLALRHDDDHSPMFLEIGALSSDEVETLRYTRS